MDFIEIDRKLNHLNISLHFLCSELYIRDRENNKYRIRKVSKKSISKGRKLYRHLYLKRHPRRIFAVCHPDELHFALGLCRKCYWKQYRDNAPPSKCHPNKKTFRRGLCKSCYRKDTKATW